MVLAPNAALCKQAVAAAESLRGADGLPLVAVQHLSTSSPPRPRQPVDIAIVTPGIAPPPPFLPNGVDMPLAGTTAGAPGLYRCAVTWAHA